MAADPFSRAQVDIAYSRARNAGRLPRGWRNAMPRLTLIAAATLLALPGAAWAQDVPAQDRPGRVAEVDAGAGAAAAMAERMEDPAFQQQLATAAAVMSEAMLDLPIGPMACPKRSPSAPRR
ncbi:MAG: hypothetical protein DI636_06145 [Pelagerythrobacter marensis]|nr:MAG: hypothetical protein DI636_06145 [Pelagerythrobacter marensis]